MTPWFAGYKGSNAKLQMILLSWKSGEDFHCSGQFCSACFLGYVFFLLLWLSADSKHTLKAGFPVRHLRKEYMDLSSSFLLFLLSVCRSILLVVVLFTKTNNILLLKMTSCPYLHWSADLEDALLFSFQFNLVWLRKLAFIACWVGSFLWSEVSVESMILIIEIRLSNVVLQLMRGNENKTHKTKHNKKPYCRFQVFLKHTALMIPNLRNSTTHTKLIPVCSQVSLFFSLFFSLWLMFTFMMYLQL